MDEQSERYCTKSSVLKYCFLILLLLITVQISFNLSVQDAAFDFVSRWTQISEELRDSSTRLSQILAQSPKTIPSTSLPTVASVTAGVTKQHVELVCDNNATSNGSSNNCIPLCPLVPEHLGKIFYRVDTFWKCNKCIYRFFLVYQVSLCDYL